MKVYGELESAQLENLAAHPSNAPRGRVYFNTTDGFVYQYDGSAWHKVTTADGTQTLSNKTLDNSTTLTVKDANLTFQDDVDTTKQAKLQLSGLTTGTTRTFTLPDATTTLVGIDTTQTLTNKSITSGKITTAVAEVDPADNTKQWNADLSTSTTGTSTTFKMAQTANRTLTFPDATDTVVARTTTDTLTNKTLGSTNTLTGATAASFTNTGTVTLPTGPETLVGRTTTDTLTNKTLSSPTLATPTLSSYADLTQVATPASPAAGKDRLYFKSDDNLYALTSAGIEKQIGSGAGGSGQKNYIGTSASNTAATWTTYGTVAATTDVTPADLPRATTTASGWKLTPSGATSGTFTVTLATPGVFTATAHGMLTGYTVTFSTNGALPTGLTAGTVYYVNVVSSSTFNVATTMANLIAGTYVATSGSQSGTHSFTFGGAYLRFTLDAADYNVKQQLQWAQNILSGAAGDWEVGVYSNTVSNYTGTYTRLPFSTDDPTTKASILPNLEGTYRTTFDAPGSAQQYIELRFNKLAANTHALVGSDLISGPGVVVQGPAVTGWTSYTPIVTNLTLNSTGKVDPTGQWRRVGDTMQVRVTWANGSGGAATGGNVSIGLPSGCTVNGGSLPTSVGGDIYIGSGYTYNVSLASQYDRTIGIRYSSGAVQIIKPATGGIIQGTDFAASAEFVGEFSVPINEWAGSGTVNVAQNDVEYQSNSSTSSSNDAASFVAGPAGQLVPTITASAVATSVAKRVRFSSPIQASDTLILEFQDAGTGNWAPIGASGSYAPFSIQGTVRYGVAVGNVNSTDVDVFFYQGGRLASGASFGATGANYPGNAADRWRLKRFSGGQAVGFGIVSSTSAGLVPASNTSLDNASATRLGLMQYLHGGSYSGGGAPTVTLSSGGGTLSTVYRGVLIPYQMNDGTWRLRVSVQVNLSSVARTSAVFAINGITFNASAVDAVCSGITNSTVVSTYAVANTNTIEMDYASTTTSLHSFSGDLELASKPTWAY